MIAVRPGDVLGYFVASSQYRAEDLSQRQGIQMDARIQDVVVFYEDLGTEPLTNGSEVSMGDEGSTMIAAPQISVRISEYFAN